jgi:hypothetical protein
VARAHFIGKLNENLRIIDKVKRLYTSGVWDISAHDAARLVGGNIYLHKTKADPSFFGGRVLSFRQVETDYAHSTRIEFDIELQAAGKDQAWEGRDDGRAWWSGIID